MDEKRAEGAGQGRLQSQLLEMRAGGVHFGAAHRRRRGQQRAQERNGRLDHGAAEGYGAPGGGRQPGPAGGGHGEALRPAEQQDQDLPGRPRAGGVPAVHPGVQSPHRGLLPVLPAEQPGPGGAQ